MKDICLINVIYNILGFYIYGITHVIDLYKIIFDIKQILK